MLDRLIGRHDGLVDFQVDVLEMRGQQREIGGRKHG